jgi:cytochrome c553
LVLYQKIFITEVILTLKALLLILPIILFAFNEFDDDNLTLDFNESELNLEEALRIESDSDDSDYTEDNSSASEVETQESFLSSVEYGRMLYKNPRGISCSKCHGDMGKGGQKIAKYYDKHKNPKILKGVDIREYSLEDLKASFKNQYRENNRRKAHKIMPMYYLTDEEVKAIYDYLQYNYEKDGKE